MNYTDPQAIEVGEVILNVAFEIFDYCGYSSDCCIQNIGGESIVFGGTNRIRFSPYTGWSCDKSYCTEKFIANFDMWRKEV